jgi:hypothetical protein
MIARAYDEVKIFDICLCTISGPLLGVIIGSVLITDKFCDKVIWRKKK